jgi:hypothetical protein
MNAEDRMDAMLDHALEMTFPASDPFTIYVPEAVRDARRRRERGNQCSAGSSALVRCTVPSGCSGGL